ncbi:MAG: DUF1735 domain-containing protein [Bacteroidales bacterium]|nr:DUF1735 domain-containing protein [Bacteroidales bacterium]
MKTKDLFLYIIGIWISVVCWSCEDNRRQNMVPDKVYLVKTGFHVEESFDIGEKYVARIWANKSGLNHTACTVTFSVDADTLESYNNASNSRFELLPDDCYTITQHIFAMKEEEQYAPFQVEYDPAKIVEAWENRHGSETGFSKYGLTDFVLPVSIASEGVDVLESQTVSFLQFTVNEPLIRILTDDFEMVRVFEGEDETIEKTIDVGMAFTNRWDGVITLEDSRIELGALVAEAKGKIKYRETRLKSKTEGDTEEFTATLTHIDGALPPADAYVISGDLSVKAGTDKLTLTCTIDKSKLYPGLNIIPVKLIGVTEPLKVDTMKNICYIPVQYVPDRSQMPIKSSSSHQSADYNPKRIAGLFDGDFDSSWRPGVGAASFPSGIANDNRPAIVVDLGAETEVTAVEIWLRGPGERQGSRTETYSGAPYITNLKIFVSSDDQCWETANGEFLLQGTTLITSPKAYWGAVLVDYNNTADNPGNAPVTLNLPPNTAGRYVIVWYGENKRANQADIWELFVYGQRQ